MGNSTYWLLIIITFQAMLAIKIKIQCYLLLFHQLLSSIFFNMTQQVPDSFTFTFSVPILPLFLELWSVVNIETPTSCSLSEFYIAEQWIARINLLGRYTIWKLSSLSELHAHCLWNGDANFLRLLWGLEFLVYRSHLESENYSSFSFSPSQLHDFFTFNLQLY